MTEEEKEREVGRKLVQALAETGQEPPIRYIQRAEDRPIDPPPPSSPVPVVDLHRLLQADGQDEAAKLRSALQSWGLFQAIGHEMSVSFLDEVRNTAREFFQLPMEVKQKYKYLTEGKLEGYESDPVANEDQILDWSDRLYLLVQPENERNLDLWPENPHSFREILHEYTMKLRKVADKILMVMAKLLDLNEEYFTQQLGGTAAVYARFNYYPCCSRPDLVFGLKPHSDGSMITIVLPDKDVEGLQVLKDGEWVRIPTNPHSFLVNFGDEMEIMSNGIFKSPVHRVVTNLEKERISLAMFYALEPEKELEPADRLVDEMHPRLYRKVKMKDYLEVFFRNFSQGKRTIDWAKI
ncbi:probable 2-oxoglutarate-dependent dioxygenase At5g05600 [Phoenix dactylifera]|uniref:Probable 2-oxoglutarate-dependent dioxygenase At5g05600 n=1 Tax=Phoenix dactylifera TaxID=42345 RepID=A0A8B7CLV4_PHODC|nr:probable 2-oxoglutarate-dependent dioxygenase At5g05600 [Phoenix dactylifera]